MLSSLRFVQPLNAELLIISKPSGRMISSNPVQSEKAEPPISVKLSGRETFFKLSMPLNILSGRRVMPSGTSIAVRSGHPLNMLLLAYLMLRGILTFFKLVQS